MNLSVDSHGEGPDLALIHGWGIGASVWDDLLPLLSAHFCVHRVTLPGYTSSAADRMQRSSWRGTRENPHGSTVLAVPAGKAPPDAPSRPSPAGVSGTGFSCAGSSSAGSADAPVDFIATAAAIADALPAGCTLCGWSLGGLLALQAALLAPQRIARLVLCGATPSFKQRECWVHAQPPALLDAFAAALSTDPAATLQRFIALLNQGDRAARANTRTLTRALAADGLADGAALARGLNWLRCVDLRVPSPTIAVPTLLIHGENDPLMPLPAARWLHASLPQSRLEIFKGAAHAPFLNDRERCARLLIDFCHDRAIP